jgi:transposase InsO family protein
MNITGVARRRRFSTDLKLAVISETMQPGMTISYVARRHGLAPSLVYRWRRLTSKHGLLLERRSGRRRPREHDGQVATIRSNCRWCSDAPEFTCWNGELVRVAFALNCRDREVIGWVTKTNGISGEMIRDMMVRRKGASMRSAPRTQCNRCPTMVRSSPPTEPSRSAMVGSTWRRAFTPVESPESNGMAEAFVKTFKRDYVRDQPYPECRRCSRLFIDRCSTAFSAGLSLTARVHPFPTRCASGLTGSTPERHILTKLILLSHKTTI